MYYIVYKITNKINGKVYIGKHQTKDLNDGYMGSGKNIRRALKKYGVENFSKEILFVFETEEMMNAKEKELVTEGFCLREDTYNICVGGQGGFSYINREGLNRIGHTLDSYIKSSSKQKGRKKEPLSVVTKAKISKKSIENHNIRYALSGVIGKPKSEEHKEKLRKVAIQNTNIQIVECPHCKKLGGDNIMQRWHFNNCRERV